MCGLMKNRLKIFIKNVIKYNINIPNQKLDEIKLIIDNYKINDITLVDMFPQTHHVESVILLQRKD